MGVKVTNNGFGTISAGINSSATTVVLDSGQGARFPTLGSGDYFYGTLVDTSNNIEIIKVTARSSDSMTVVRAQDNTTGRAFSVGDRFELRPTAALFEDIITGAEVVNDTSPQLGGNLDLNSNDITGLTANNGFAIFKSNSGNPSGTPVTGQVFVDTAASNTPKIYDGSQFKAFYTPPLSVTTSGNPTVTTPGDGYKYYFFNSSGTFGVNRTSTADEVYVWVIGGGGGGGGSDNGVETAGGGGGGGGMVAGNIIVNSSQNCTITIGAGGATAAAGTSSSFVEPVASSNDYLATFGNAGAQGTSSAINGVGGSGGTGTIGGGTTASGSTWSNGVFGTGGTGSNGNGTGNVAVSAGGNGTNGAAGGGGGGNGGSQGTAGAGGNGTSSYYTGGGGGGYNDNGGNTAAQASGGSGYFSGGNGGADANAVATAGGGSYGGSAGASALSAGGSRSCNGGGGATYGGGGGGGGDTQNGGGGSVVNTCGGHGGDGVVIVRISV